MNPNEEKSGELFCRIGNHTFPSTDRYVQFSRPGKPDTYACNDCDAKERSTQYEMDGIIRSQTWMDAEMLGMRLERQERERIEMLKSIHGPDHVPSKIAHHPPDWAALLVSEMAAVSALAKKWQREVWFNGIVPAEHPEMVSFYAEFEGDENMLTYREGVKPPEGSLQRFVVEANYKGYSASVAGLSYLSYTMAGRSIFQIQDDRNQHFVSIILDETGPYLNGGVRSICARAEEAMAFIRHAIDDWKAGKISLQRSDGVGFGF